MSVRSLRLSMAHLVPFAIMEHVEKERDQLKEGLLCRVDNAQWALPIIPIPKKDSSI